MAFTARQWGRCFVSTVMRSSALMASGTVVSRLTGILRDVAAAAALGFYLVADAFSLGNSLPTIIYILVVGGALNAVFVPQLVRRMKDDPDDGRAYADRLLTLVGTVLLLPVLVYLVRNIVPWLMESDYAFPLNLFKVLRAMDSRIVRGVVQANIAELRGSIILLSFTLLAFQWNLVQKVRHVHIRMRALLRGRHAVKP